MYFCPKCNFLLDITKSISSQNSKRISSVDVFIEKSLNNDLNNVSILDFSENELINSSIFKKLDNKVQKMVKSKYKIYSNNNLVSAYFFCDNCNYNAKLESGTIIFKTDTSNNLEESNEILLSRVLDMTLPRTKDFICPNQKCETNKSYNNVNREAVFYRPDSNSYNLKYICCFCKMSWSPYFQVSSK